MSHRRLQKLLWIFFLAVMLMVINAARGSGIHDLKPFELIFMFACAFTIMYDVKPLWKRYLGALLYAIPIGGMFAIGTGELMPYFTSWINWRGAEMIIGSVWTLVFFLPLWIFKKI